MARPLLLALVTALALGVVMPGRARADAPSDTRLVLTGIALAPPTYLAGVALHEGSHALAARLVGGTVEQIRLFPPGFDPRTGTFRFGWVYARGLRTRNERLLFYLAPKISDALLLGAYSALALTDHLPASDYGTLALTVWATGLWIDFAKDVVLFSRHNDVVKGLDQWCMKGWKQVPARLVYAAASAGFAYAVWRGYERLFGDPSSGASMAATRPALVLPLAATTF